MGMESRHLALSSRSTIRSIGGVMKVNIPIMKADPLMLVTDKTEWEWDGSRWKRLDVPDEIWAENVTRDGSEENVKLILSKLED